MALVNYENSDSSEYEDEDDVQPSISTIKSKEFNPVQVRNDMNSITSEIKDDLHSTESVIFKLLPQPSKKTTTEEEDDEFLKKKESFVKPKAKIMVPSLNDFKDVGETVPSKPKLGSTKKSGLLSILPQPKNTVTSSVISSKMIPHALIQKTNSVPVKQKMSLKPSKDVSSIGENKLSIDYSDDDDDEIQNDFFSINKSTQDTEKEIMIENENIDKNHVSITNLEAPGVQKMPHNIDAFLKSDDVTSNRLEVQPNSSIDDQDYTYSENYETANIDDNAGSMELDEEAILKLVGARGRRKKEDIQIVDVNQQEVLQNAREMFMKGLLEDTTKRVSSSKRKGNEPTTQQKRKHQITYLAHQAKANEIELQNQWANNRMTRRQTQSKYGF